MEYSALTIGLSDDLFSSIQTLLAFSHLRFTPSLTVQDASRLLIQQVFHLLIVDLEYLRSIQQIDWLPSVRRVTFVPIVVLSNTLERDLLSLIHLVPKSRVWGDSPKHFVGPSASKNFGVWTHPNCVSFVCAPKSRIYLTFIQIYDNLK